MSNYPEQLLKQAVNAIQFADSRRHFRDRDLRTSCYTEAIAKLLLLQQLDVVYFPNETEAGDSNTGGVVERGKENQSEV